MEKTVDVETIDWANWQSTQAVAQMITNAKHMAATSVCVVNQDMTEHPVAIIRKGSKIFSKATRAIEIGALKVPLFSKKFEIVVEVAAHEAGSMQPALGSSGCLLACQRF